MCKAFSGVITLPKPIPFDVDEEVTNSVNLKIKPFQDVNLDFGRFKLKFNSKDSDIRIYQLTEFKGRKNSFYKIPHKNKYIIQIEMETPEFIIQDLGDDNND
jgi:hypothetical protein